MAEFTGSYYYSLVEQSPGVFYINTRHNVPTTYYGDAPDGYFEVGQQIYFESDGIPITEVIVGFTSDGIIAQSRFNSQFYFTTNNANYVYGQQLDSNTNPFPVCFVNGTLIDTDHGPVAVESLSIGDKVVGLSGMRTVKWIGWRHYHAVSLRSPEQRTKCLPIRIAQGALGEGKPNKTLRVSPWHHLLVDDVLVRAMDLVNGQTIVQESNTTEFTYYHIELDQFDVVCAHGVFSESWADGGNRDFFQNVDVTTLRPEDMQRRLAARPGFVVVRKAEDIARIRAKLADQVDSATVARNAA